MANTVLKPRHPDSPNPLLLLCLVILCPQEGSPSEIKAINAMSYILQSREFLGELEHIGGAIRKAMNSLGILPFFPQLDLKVS